MDVHRRHGKARNTWPSVHLGLTSSTPFHPHLRHEWVAARGTNGWTKQCTSSPTRPFVAPSSRASMETAAASGCWSAQLAPRDGCVPLNKYYALRTHCSGYVISCATWLGMVALRLKGGLDSSKPPFVRHTKPYRIAAPICARSDYRGVEAAPATAPVPPPTAAPTAAPGAHPTGSVTTHPIAAPRPAPVAPPATARAPGSGCQRPST